MNLVSSLFQRIKEQVESFKEPIHKTESAISALKVELGRVKQQEDDVLQGRLKECDEKEAKLNAFIGISRAHSSQLKDNGTLATYNVGTLSRLAVQINHSLCNDPFAAELYTSAMAQLRWIKLEREKIKKESEEVVGKLSDQVMLELHRQETNSKTLTEMIRSIASSDIMEEFANKLKKESDMFSEWPEADEYKYTNLPTIAIGTTTVSIHLPEKYFLPLKTEVCQKYAIDLEEIRIPVSMDSENDRVVVTEYLNSTEEQVLSGVQNYLLNILRYWGGECSQISYIDPIRCSDAALGALEPLCGESDSIVKPVPWSADEIRKRLDEIIIGINTDTKSEKSCRKKQVLVFHNFPQSYDSKMVSQIQQLVVNAGYYNLYIWVTHNSSSKNTVQSEAFEYIKTLATTIKCTDSGQFVLNRGTDLNQPFQWYISPNTLPAVLRRHYIDEKPVVDKSNNYEKRIGFNELPHAPKGVRQITNIPYGVDEEGNILSLDFENTNFATFICGASRSGKSTLLHTIITGIIRNNHPDDIEMWLIDFKMTEFSRYINHLPPHVRYIVLDESPELVYDIIDRLTEIMGKRQNAFKGKWQKLNEVPAEKYMPAMLIIIDEFSVMSQIVADSATLRENYSVKLQTLLAKGAALGMHFIFSSQGFTSGTRGLNDFSKKQIQQRIAMKTEYNEIKETLDLKTASDADKAMMEQLVIHHTLVRIPVDEQGNHLQQAEVLFIPDYSKQEMLIDKIRKSVTPSAKYDPNDVSVYIDKKTLIIDGNSFHSFTSCQESMAEYLSSNRNALYDDDETLLFLGEPRRMLALAPIEVINGFCENILLLAPQSESMPAASVLMSMIESLKIQQHPVEIWTARKNPLYRQIVQVAGMKPQKIVRDLDDICYEIKNLRAEIETGVEANRFIILLGFETLLIEMSYQMALEDNKRKPFMARLADMTIEQRDPNELDMNSQLELLMGGALTTEVVMHSQTESHKVNVTDTPNDFDKKPYDARDDLKFILTQGSRLGYHFVLVLNSAGEFHQCRFDGSIFKHKLLFRASKADAASIVSPAEAGLISDLDNHSFRYSNGLESLSFHPYLHPTLSWDGWKLSDEGVIADDEEEEYLM